MNNTLTLVLVYLIKAIFYFYSFVIILRIILQKLRVPSHNPIAKAMILLTNPILKPLHKILPIWGGYDVAAMVLLYVFNVIKNILLTAISASIFPGVIGLLIWTLGDVINYVINFYFFAIILQAILSWVNPGVNNPVAGLLLLIANPLLKPVREILPPLGGIDLTPLPVLLILGVLYIINTQIIVMQGISLALASIIPT